MTMKTDIRENILVPIALIEIAMGTAFPLLHMATVPWRWIYAAGALILLLTRLSQAGADDKSESLRRRRLKRLGLWASIMFGAGVFFMFYPGAGATDWLAFTLAGAAIQAYSSLMLSWRRADK